MSEASQPAAILPQTKPKHSIVATYWAPCFAVTCVLAVFGVPKSAAAQDSSEDEVDVQNTAVQTADGWNINLTYYKSKLGKEASAVILLHMEGGSRLVWTNGFAERLNEDGYAVIAVDLRMHGQSEPANAALSNSVRPRRGNRLDLKPFDYQRMVTQDLEAVKRFIYEEHQQQNLNMRKTAIIAPGMSAALALNFAMLDWLKLPYNDAPTFEARTPRGQDIRALVLISPDENLPGLQSNPALMRLRNPNWGVSFLICYGTKDGHDRGQAEKIYRKLTSYESNEDRMYLDDFPVKLRGTDMLGRDLKLETHILAFLDNHLKQLGDAWRDRKSPLIE